MGLHKFWEEFGSKERTSLFQHAEEHFRRHGRPFRIAVDFACWYNKSVGEQKAHDIREETQRYSHTIEKNAILYPAIRCLKHGIQLIFIFDGKDRPVKRGKVITQAVQTAEDERNALSKETLTALGIPWRKAPGEAEAECAALAEAEVVDAVWTNDSDAFMFGAGVVIRHAYDVDKSGKQSKSNTHVHLYKAEDIAEQLDLPMPHDKVALKHALVLYALLAGGDYNTKGFGGWGSKKARKVMREIDSNGLLWGTALVRAYETHQTAAWGRSFDDYCASTGNKCLKAATIDRAALWNYLHPRVSAMSDIQVQWDSARIASFEQLRSHLTMHFNFSVQEYLRHISAMFLVRKLLEASNHGTTAFNIEVMKAGSRKESGNVKHWTIEYDISPFMPRTILETWPCKDTKATTQVRPYKYDPRVRTEVLDYILEHALPDIMALKHHKSTAKLTETHSIKRQKLARADKENTSNQGSGGKRGSTHQYRGVDKRLKSNLDGLGVAIPGDRAGPTRIAQTSPSRRPLHRVQTQSGMQAARQVVAVTTPDSIAMSASKSLHQYTTCDDGSDFSDSDLDLPSIFELTRRIEAASPCNAITRRSPNLVLNQDSQTVLAVDSVGSGKTASQPIELD